MKTGIFILWLLACPSFIYAQKLIDHSSFLNENQQSDLVKKIKGIEKNTTVEIMIYTDDTLYGLEPDVVGIELSYQYPNGKKGVNNGIIIVLSKKDRKFQILTAYGLEWILCDTVLQTFVSQITPYLKNGDFYEGIDVSVDLMYGKFSQYDWTVAPRKLDEITEADTMKVLQIDYDNTEGNRSFRYPLSTDPQFSREFNYPLKEGDIKYTLYYSKYMSNLMETLSSSPRITIYARLRDWKNKELIVLGAEAGMQ